MTTPYSTVPEPAYVPKNVPRSQFLPLRGLNIHAWIWGNPELATPQAPLLVMVHGWMDVGASFQFMVDALRARPGWGDRPMVALDWRGFGLSQCSGRDSYFFVDYLADLDAALELLAPGQKVDLLGHSMGGNVTTLYAGVRASRLRKLVNLEGFGMPASTPEDAPKRYESWLQELRKPAALKDYPDLAGVAARLQANNPRLRGEHAQWLAAHWAHEAGGRWVINADPAHKRPQPFTYRWEEVREFLRRIHCPMLFVEGAQTLYFNFFDGRFNREEFLERMREVPQFELLTLQDAGHMIHHDQPEALAEALASFLRPGD